MSTPFHQRLYLRIWLAVVATIAVLALVAGWLARLEFEQERAERERERAERPGREIVLRNEAGDVIGQAPLRPTRVPGQGPEFQVTMVDGTTLFIQLPRPNRPFANRVEPGQQPMRMPFGFAWMLGLVALAVAIATYPIVRRLTKRLETVQQGVERWGAGDLSTRLSEDGQDEVAFLATRFNNAAERIQTLIQSHESLLASQKSLLANASHELRSPLTRIRMGLELMGTTSSPASRNEIARNIGELDQLIDEILLASRLDAREADLGSIESVDLIGLAAEECARVQAELDVQSGDGASVLAVQGVSKLLRRAVRNLLENARRHGAGEVTVTLQQASDTAVVRVCDHGPGVPVELRERIFEPFYRLPGATERDGGVGLGLSLVKSIATRHGGSVHCENAPGGGACFVLSLPLAIENAQKA
ncbi:MAG TPA: ATP-binding protein [Burkholderiaceae bacterium]|nr:ATP-binding protein [Burkholderiaceae bacterium]